MAQTAQFTVSWEIVFPFERLKTVYASPPVFQDCHLPLTSDTSLLCVELISRLGVNWNFHILAAESAHFNHNERSAVVKDAALKMSELVPTGGQRMAALRPDLWANVSELSFQ